MVSLASVTVTPTTDTTIPAFDNTRLVAINTCPTDGILRYTLNKRMHAGGRAMALEAGAAAHEVFAAHRLYQFGEYAADELNLSPEFVATLMNDTGIRMYGRDRYAAMLDSVDPREDARTRVIQFSLHALHSGPFYDDPSDRRRTVTNIEEMCIGYMDTYNWHKQLPAVLDFSGTPMLGIEIPIDVTITFAFDDGMVETYRFIGKADGIHHVRNDAPTLRVHENKTASRLGDAWEQSWNTNHQPTGYMIALSALLNKPIQHALLLGSTLPLPKAFSINGFSRVPIEREAWEFQEWFDWFLHTAHLHDQYADDVVHAPKYTHSCNRYFRPCAFIPFCGTPPEEREQMIEEMHDEVWSPLHEVQVDD